MNCGPATEGASFRSRNLFQAERAFELERTLCKLSLTAHFRITAATISDHAKGVYRTHRALSFAISRNHVSWATFYTKKMEWNKPRERVHGCLALGTAYARQRVGDY